MKEQIIVGTILAVCLTAFIECRPNKLNDDASNVSPYSSNDTHKEIHQERNLTPELDLNPEKTPESISYTESEKSLKNESRIESKRTFKKVYTLVSEPKAEEYPEIEFNNKSKQEANLESRALNKSNSEAQPEAKSYSESDIETIAKLSDNQTQELCHNDSKLCEIETTSHEMPKPVEDAAEPENNEKSEETEEIKQAIEEPSHLEPETESKAQEMPQLDSFKMPEAETQEPEQQSEEHRASLQDDEELYPEFKNESNSQNDSQLETTTTPKVETEQESHQTIADQKESRASEHKDEVPYSKSTTKTILQKKSQPGNFTTIKGRAEILYAPQLAINPTYSESKTEYKTMNVSQPETKETLDGEKSN